MKPEALTPRAIEGCIALGAVAPEFCAVGFDGVLVSARRVRWSPIWGPVEIGAPHSRPIGVAERLLGMGLTEEEIRTLGEWGSDPADDVTPEDWVHSAAEAIRELSGPLPPIILTPVDSEWSTEERLRQIHDALELPVSGASGSVGRATAAATAATYCPAGYSLLAVRLGSGGAELAEVPLYTKGQALEKQGANTVGPIRFSQLADSATQCSVLLLQDGEIVRRCDAGFRGGSLEVRATFRFPEEMPSLEIGGLAMRPSEVRLDRAAFSVVRREQPVLVCIILEATLRGVFPAAISAISGFVKATANLAPAARFAFVSYGDYGDDAESLVERGSENSMTADEVLAVVKKAANPSPKDAYVALDRGLRRACEILTANPGTAAYALLIAQHPPHPPRGEDYPGSGNFYVEPAEQPWREPADEILQRCRQVCVAPLPPQGTASFLMSHIAAYAATAWSYFETEGGVRLDGLAGVGAAASQVQAIAAWETKPLTLPVWRTR